MRHNQRFVRSSVWTFVCAASRHSEQLVFGHTGTFVPQTCDASDTRNAKFQGFMCVAPRFSKQSALARPPVVAITPLLRAGATQGWLARAKALGKAWASQRDSGHR